MAIFWPRADPGQPGAAIQTPKNYSQGVGLTLIIPSKSFGKVTLLFSGDGQTFFLSALTHNDLAKFSINSLTAFAHFAFAA